MKLLPCPFCGTIPPIPAGASVWTDSWYDKAECGLTASVRCPGCGIFVLGKQVKKTEKASIKEACRAWNTRKGEVMNVKIKDMSWPLPDGDLEHTIRYNRDLSEVERLRAASILSAYAQMVRDPQKKRQMVIGEIRKALRGK